MGYQLLITLDLNNATSEQRETFYGMLTEEKWIKLTNLTTAWRCSFSDGVNRIQAEKQIKSDLEKAMLKTKIKKVDYALQMDKVSVLVASIP